MQVIQLQFIMSILDILLIISKFDECIRLLGVGVWVTYSQLYIVCALQQFTNIRSMFLNWFCFKDPDFTIHCTSSTKIEFRWFHALGSQ